MTPAASGTADRERAIACDGSAGAVAFAGAAGSGKTTALLARATRLAAGGKHVLLTSANPRAVRAFASSRLPAGVVVRSFEDVALEILRANRFATRLSPDLDLLPEARAARLFEQIGARLFAKDWTEFVSPEIDPEITGLRAPERFAAAAFRLIRRLRAAGIDPARFRTSCLHGAAEFYGRPPNFADPDLLSATKPKDRDSLQVGPEELDRQRLRELDLARILSQL